MGRALPVCLTSIFKASFLINVSRETLLCDSKNGIYYLVLAKLTVAYYILRLLWYFF